MSRRDLWLWSALLLVPGALFLFPFLFGRSHFVGDITFSFHPWFSFAAQEIQAGRFPLWDSYSSCGQPLSANPPVMLLSPLASLFWIFDFADAWRLFLLLSQGMLLAGVTFVARSQKIFRADRTGAALAALAVAWGGFSVVHWEFPAVAGTLPWVLFLFLFSAARANHMIPLAAALLVLGGYAQLTNYGILWAGAAVFWTAIKKRRPSALFFWGFGLSFGLLLTLPQILPSWELAGMSLRTGVTAGDTRTYLLTPALLVKWIVPNIIDKVALAFSPTVFGAGFWPVQRNWLTTFYIGTAPSLLALTGLMKRRSFPLFLTATGGGFLLLALGVDPLFRWIVAIVPGFRYMTHFANAAVITVLAGSFLAATNTSSASKKLFFLALGLACLCGIVAVTPGPRVGILRSLLGLSSLSPLQDRHVQRAFLSVAVFALFTAGLSTLGNRGRGAGLLLLTLLELWLNGRDIHPTVDTAYFDRPFSLTHLFQDNQHRFALRPEILTDRPMAGSTLAEGYQSLRNVGHPNTPLPYRVPMAWSYDVFNLRDFTTFRRLLLTTEMRGPVLNFLSVSDIVSDRFLPPPFVPVAQSPNGFLYRNPEALSRVSWVVRSTDIPDAVSRLDYLRTHWDPRREVVIEEAVPDAPLSPTSAASIDISWEETPGRVVIRGAGDSGWLVYSGVYFPGWESYVNGKKTKIYRANHAFQTVRVPAGSWNVHWLYRPFLFRMGLGLSLGGLLIWGVWIARRARRLVVS